MTPIRNLKKTIKTFEKSIVLLKECDNIEKTKEALQKVKILFKKISWLYKFLEIYQFDNIITDFQVESLRERILSDLPKGIETFENKLQGIKSQQSKIPKKTIAIVSIIIIGVLIFLFFPRPPVLEVKITPGSSLYSFQWSNGQWTGNSVNYTIEVKNNGNEDLQGVLVTDSAGFDWTGALKAGEIKNFVVIYIGELKDDLVISANAQGSNSEGDVFSHSAETTIDIFGGTYDLQFATEEGLITWEFKGKGACSGETIVFSAKLNIDLSIDIKLDTPLILSNSGTGQNMIICDQKTLSLVPDIEHDFTLDAYCLDLHKSNPSSSETFTILGDSNEYGEDVITLINYINSLESDGPEITSIQIAVWVLTDNIERDGIPFSYDEQHITRAKGLLEGAGIDITNYKLFQ